MFYDYYQVPLVQKSLWGSDCQNDVTKTNPYVSDMTDNEGAFLTSVQMTSALRGCSEVHTW